MLTIYKYSISDAQGGYSSNELPVGAKILSSAFQGNDLFIWALVDTDAVKERRYFLVFPTGSDIGSYAEQMLIFINTAFIGSLVFHVFEYKMN